jgi:anti-sigma factor RsiW
MSCNAHEILLYIEGELAPGDAARVRAHVAVCGPCRELLLAEQSLELSLGGLGTIDPPKDFANATVSRARCDLTSAVASPRERRRAATVVASLSVASLLLLWPTGMIDAAIRSLAPLRCLSRFAFCWLSSSGLGALIVARTISRHVFSDSRLPVGLALVALALLVVLLFRMIGWYRAQAGPNRGVAK